MPSTTKSVAGATIHFGANVPVGDKKKNSTGAMLPRKKMLAKPHDQPPDCAAAASKLLANASDPNVTSITAMNRAMRSSDFSQEITTPTANATSANRHSTAITYAAKNPTELPSAASSCRLVVSSTDFEQGLAVQTLWRRPNSSRKPATQ